MKAGQPAHKPYRPKHAEALQRIDERRRVAGVSLAVLAVEAGMSERTARRIFKSGLAFRRHVNALSMAMRTFEREVAAHDDAFPTGGIHADD